MLGSELRKLRTRSAMRVVEVAKALGVSRATYYRWESTGLIPPRQISRFAVLLDLDGPTTDRLLRMLAHD